MYSARDESGCATGKPVSDGKEPATVNAARANLAVIPGK
jgi:hypothetical protein